MAVVPLHGGSPTAETPQTQQNKEASLIFVRSVTKGPVLTAHKVNADNDGTPRLELTPGTRIQAKLETQVSSAVLAPVVAVANIPTRSAIESSFPLARACTVNFSRPIEADWSA
jgi:hypothetical protein